MNNHVNLPEIQMIIHEVTLNPRDIGATNCNRCLHVIGSQMPRWHNDLNLGRRVLLGNLGCLQHPFPYKPAPTSKQYS
jgi:hypothetical protein